MQEALVLRIEPDEDGEPDDLGRPSSWRKDKVEALKSTRDLIHEPHATGGGHQACDPLHFNDVHRVSEYGLEREVR